jgi:hypothetical protein
MKVVDNRKNKEMKTVGELPLGMAYLDKDGVLCIKTGDDGEGYCCCLAYVNDEWRCDEEYFDVKVTPITTTLTIGD